VKVIVAGGTGLIGSALVAELARDHDEVVVLTRQSPASVRLPAGVRAARWDGRTAAGWGELVEGATAVVNLAGENVGAGRWTAARKQRLRASRLDAGAAIVAAIERAADPPAVLIQASGISIYGDRGEAEIDEAAPAGEDFLARLAVEWEASTAAVERRGVRRAILRTALVLAPRGGALPRLLLPLRLFAGGPLGDGRQGFPWIHLSDEVRAIRFLIERRDLAGPLNLVAPQTLAQRDFCRAAARALRRPCWLPAPAFALRLVLGEMAEMVLTGQRAVPRRLAAAGFAFRFPAVDAALADLLG
jgi:uncharacterized protein (TIGR01777 family)